MVINDKSVPSQSVLQQFKIIIKENNYINSYIAEWLVKVAGAKPRHSSVLTDDLERQRRRPEVSALSPM